MKCVVKGCKSNSSKMRNNTIIGFHRFPSEPDLKQKWIDAISRPQWSWNKHHRICSRHFGEDCFLYQNCPNINQWKRKTLRPNSIPSINMSGKTFLKLAIINGVVNDKNLRSPEIGGTTMVQSLPDNLTNEQEFTKSDNGSQASRKSNRGSEELSEFDKDLYCDINEDHSYHFNVSEDGNMRTDLKLLKLDVMKYKSNVLSMEEDLAKVETISTIHHLNIQAMKQRIIRITKKNTVLIDKIVEAFAPDEDEMEDDVKMETVLQGCWETT